MVSAAWQCALLLTVWSSASAQAVKPRIRPYEINVDASLIEATRQKAQGFRPTIDIDQPTWTDGPPSSNVTELARFWAEEYDWSAEQSHMNEAFDHFMATTPPPGGNYSESVDIHFIHQRSSRGDAIPMLMLHGWPSTSMEWEKVIPGLVSPGDNSKPAFHVVAPDLPGYGFSPAPVTPGLGPNEHATVFADLMRQLGYQRWVIYSTDLGFAVGLAQVMGYEANIINHITDFYYAIPNATDFERFAAGQTTPEETAFIASVAAFMQDHTAYSALHSTLPLSIAHALNDSPVGFLAWMWQLVYTVSDKGYTASELITQAQLLYIPGVYGNIRSYKELFPALGALASGEVQKTSVPTSVLQFGGVDAYPALQNFNYAPRHFVERTANVTYFSRHDKGGHFPAWSEPELVLQDIRAIFEA